MKAIGHLENPLSKDEVVGYWVVPEMKATGRKGRNRTALIVAMKNNDGITRIESFGENMLHVDRDIRIKKIKSIFCINPLNRYYGVLVFVVERKDGKEQLISGSKALSFPESTYSKIKHFKFDKISGKFTLEVIDENGEEQEIIFENTNKFIGVIERKVGSEIKEPIVVLKDKNTLIIDGKKIHLQTTYSPKYIERVIEVSDGFIINFEIYVDWNGKCKNIEKASRIDMCLNEDFYLVECDEKTKIYSIWSSEKQKVVGKGELIGDKDSIRVFGESDQYVVQQYKTKTRSKSKYNFKHTFKDVDPKVFEKIYEATDCIPNGVIFDENDRPWCSFTRSLNRTESIKFIPLYKGTKFLIRELKKRILIEDNPVTSALRMEGLMPTSIPTSDNQIWSITPEDIPEKYRFDLLKQYRDYEHVPASFWQNTKSIINSELNEYKGGDISHEFLKFIQSAVPLTETHVEQIDRFILSSEYGIEFKMNLPSWYKLPQDEAVKLAKKISREENGREYPLSYETEGKEWTLAQKIIYAQMFNEVPVANIQLDYDAEQEAQNWKNMNDRLKKMYPDATNKGGEPNLKRFQSTGSVEQITEVLKNSLERPFDMYLIYMLASVIFFIISNIRVEKRKNKITKILIDMTRMIKNIEGSKFDYTVMRKEIMNPEVLPREYMEPVEKMLKIAENMGPMSETAKLGAVLIGTLPKRKAKSVIKNILTHIATAFPLPPNFANTWHKEGEVKQLDKIIQIMSETEKLFEYKESIPFTEIMKAMMDKMSSLPYDAKERITKIREDLINGERSQLEKVRGSSSIDQILKQMGELIGSKKVISGREGKIAGYREYCVGDDIRDVDWKATARREKVIIREYSTDVEKEIVVFFADVFEIADNLEAFSKRLFLLLLKQRKQKKPFEVILSCRGTPVLRLPQIKKESGNYDKNPYTMIENICETVLRFTHNAPKGAKKISNTVAGLMFDPKLADNLNGSPHVIKNSKVVFLSEEMPNKKVIDILVSGNNDIYRLKT